MQGIHLSTHAVDWPPSPYRPPGGGRAPQIPPWTTGRAGASRDRWSVKAPGVGRMGAELERPHLHPLSAPSAPHSAHQQTLPAACREQDSYGTGPGPGPQRCGREAGVREPGGSGRPPRRSDAVLSTGPGTGRQRALPPLSQQPGVEAPPPALVLQTGVPTRRTSA